MSLIRGLTGALLGAAKRALEAGYRLVTEGLRLGRPAPTPEIAEEVRVVGEFIQTLPEREALEAFGHLTRIENQYVVRELFGARPYGVIFESGKLPEGPFRWQQAEAGMTLKFRFVHPIFGEEVEQPITITWTGAERFESLLERAIRALIDSPLQGMEPEWIEFEVVSASSRRAD
jgi:hypothetical protein